MTRNAQALLAYVVLTKGDENEAVQLFVNHLNCWMMEEQKKSCTGCMQQRVGDTMLTCNGCRVARSV